MEIESYMRFVFALVFVLGLIGVLAALGRRYGMGYKRSSRGGDKRRLAIVEVIPIDARRRLILVERDDVQHLLVLGSTSETVVETGIPRKLKQPPPAFATHLGGDGSKLKAEEARKENAS